jgi:hypothetical protein
MQDAAYRPLPACFQRRLATSPVTTCAPELAELIRAANAVLKAQESTLLRVVTKQLHVVNGESRADGHQCKNGAGAKLLTH